MTFPSKAVTRLFQFTFRNSFCGIQRSCSIIRTSPFYYLKSHNIKLRSGLNNLIGNRSSAITQVRAMGALSPLDPSSFSRPELAKIKHVALSLNVDFTKKVLSGVATLNFDVFDDLDEVILDARDLNIESIELDGNALEYNVGEHVANFGSKLTIKLPKPEVCGHTSHVNVEVGRDVMKPKTTQDCSCTTQENVSCQLPLTFSGFLYHTSEPKAVVSLTEFGVQTEDICEYQLTTKTCCACKPRIKLKIKYSTSPTASALQWLAPEQTSGKKHPYLFSQCQPIHARSILPCQDTPSVKFTYEAEVTAPPEFTVLMSAIRGECVNNVTSFKQPMPLPSYLVAIAVGVLESRTLGPRSKVWSEKEEIERSAWEFADTEKYLQAAERLCGPYEWTQYDLLLLPSSFPYGGMENPCLTFVTPTLLAGDRSQADVIVHEIMHSWTGNLVTNRNFEHFWLNEGFTVFLERKVGASLIEDPVSAKQHRDFQSILGLQELNETICCHLGADNALTRLVPNLLGVHPDDAFSRVPYEKGSLFLRYLEDLLQGPEVFDEFLRAYITKFKRKSLDTNEFKAFLLDYFKDSDSLKNVDWDTWFYSSGMPPVIPQYDPTMSKSVKSLVERIKEKAKLSYSDVESFTPHQMVYLMQLLVDRPPLPLNTLKTLGAEYKVDSSQNTEIKFRWLRLCIRSKDKSKLKDVFNFVNSQGRMKYVRPIYRDLYDWEQVRSQAVANFLENEKFMMHVSAYTLKKDLRLTTG